MSNSRNGNYRIPKRTGSTRGGTLRKILHMNLTDYPQETTIHCLKYMASRGQSWPERLFWIIVLSVSIAALIFFASKIVTKWMNFPVMIAENSKPTYIFEIPFPAVTICPAIKAKKHQFSIDALYDEMQKYSNITEFFDSEYERKLIMASQICRPSFVNYSETIIENQLRGKRYRKLDFHQFLDMDWFRTLHEMSPNHDDVLTACALSTWNEDSPFAALSRTNCEQLFSTIITNEGVCFTFNTIAEVLRNNSLYNNFSYHDIKHPLDGWDPELGYNKFLTYPFKAIVKGNVHGSQNGLKIVLSANISDITSVCHPIGLGYKILLHTPTAYPNSYENYIQINQGKEYKIALQPKTITTAPNLRTFQPENRQCYFQNERPLKYYTYYNENNCKLECYANYTRLMFGATPFSSPIDANTRNTVLVRKDYGWEFPHFYGLLHEHNKIYNFLSDNNSLSSSYRFDADTDCNCLPECNSIKYDYVINTLNAETMESMALKHAEIVTTTVEILFNEPSFVGQERIKTYKFATLVSNFGGLLGLFMGGSLLSVFEFIYFVTIRNYWKRRR